MTRLFGWIAGVVVLSFTQAAATETTLTTAGSDQRPAWSPDGNTIVFDSNRSGNRDLWSIPSTGGTATQITTGLVIDQHGDWSPSSDKLVFSMGASNQDLYIIPAGGGSPVLLFSDSTTVDRFPSWSPDSTQIAFSHGNDIYIVPAAGGPAVQVTTHAGVDLHPSWSPDGTMLTFLSDRSGNNDIWTIPASGGAAVQITTDTGNDGAPDWSPDGSQIAFQSNRSGNNCIYVIPSTGGVATAITTGTSNDVQPDWSPEGNRLVFARGGNLIIYQFPTADIALAKSINIVSPIEGDTVTFTVTATNDGPDAANNVQVTDLLPAGLTFVSASATQGTYTSGTGVWDVGALALGQADTLTVTATVDAGTEGTTLVNTASLTGLDEADINTSNDIASVSIPVQVSLILSEVQITTAGSDQRPAWSPDGNLFVFDSNRSGNRDLWTLPVAGGTATQMTTSLFVDFHSDWSPGSDVIVFAAGTSAGANEDLYFIPATGGTPVLLDSDPANQDRFPSWSPDSTMIAYAKGTDIYLIPSTGGTPVQLTTDPGTDTHPTWSPDGTQIAFLSNRTGNNDLFTIPVGGGPVTQITTDPANDGAPDWSPNGQMIAFQSNRLGGNCIYIIPAIGGTAQRVTTASGNDVQPDWAPNGNQVVFSRSGNLWVTSMPGVDIELDLVADVATPNEGDPVLYTLVVTNNGPDAATGVEVTDLLPAGVSYQSETISKGSYQSATGVWTVGPLAVGESDTLAIVASVDPGAGGSTVLNSASVTAVDQTDGNPYNDTASASITVPSIDLSVAKTVNLSVPNEGGTITYTVILQNGGPDDATGVNVLDILPAGITYVSDTTTQGSYDDETGVWDVGALNNGGAAVMAITATVDSGTAGQVIPNTATASADQGDPSATNNASTANITVQSADLSVVKTVDNAAPTAGSSVVYTVALANAGPNTAIGVEVTDNLPAGLVFVSASATQGSYD
ncbi:MAG: DUF11 domain-containing protein, partial [Gemmatimonadetes bacterium]|nr:DUF11 domain-containing protein [Gemmatimonadota bacterium]